MTAFLTARRYKAELNGVYTEITSYVIGDVTGKWGISGNGPLDLVADPGAIRLVLNNQDQRFDPDSDSALSGWREGIGFKLEFDYEGETYVHKGTVTKISVPLSDDLFDTALVTVSDWLETSALHPIVNPGIETNQRTDEALTTLLGLMPIAPAATDLAEGAVLPTTFDTVTSKTRAYSEFDKLARSEAAGYLYLRKDRTYGETFVFESRQTRHGWRALSDLPVGASASGLLLKEDGDQLLLETGDGILLNEVTTLTLDNTMIDLEAEHGARVINYFTVHANPRKVDASPQVLFALNEPILIGSGQTIDIKGTYADPAGGLPINANPDDMITPVVTTDYLVNTASDGGGTNISADLTLVEIIYGTEGFTHRVRNDNANAGYITKWSPRGYGIYKYNPIEHVEKNDESIAARGYKTESMDMPYQTSLVDGTLYARKVVDEYSTPRTRLDAVTLLANQSAELMLAFLNFGPGNLIRIIHDRRKIDNYFFIQGIKDFKITDGGLIMYTWLVKQFWSLSLGLEPLAVEFAYDSNDAVNFGYMPHVSDLSLRSYSAWVYRDAFDTPNVAAMIIGQLTDLAGVGIYLGSNNTKLNLQIKCTGQQGFWETATGLLPADGAWHHIVVTIDTNTITPLAYVDGSSATLTETVVHVGSIQPENGVPLMIGNQLTATIPQNLPFNGRIKDVRIYNRILSSSEVTTLRNSGTPDPSLVTDGLVFQAFCVRLKDLSLYEDATLTEELGLLDNIYGMLGTPNGAPIGRAF